MTNYPIRIIDIIEHDIGYDLITHIYKDSIEDKNLMHIMTITLYPKPPKPQIKTEAMRAIKFGLKAYLANKNKILKDKPVIDLNYDDTTDEVN